MTTDHADRAAEVRDALACYVDLRERLDRGGAPWVEVALLFTEDAVFVDPVWGRVEGRDGITHLFETAMPGVDFSYPIDFTAIDGDWVVVKWRQVLPGAKPDGGPWEQSGISTLRYGHDGCFDYEEDLLNMGHVMEDIVASGWQPGEGFTAPPADPARDFAPPPR